MPARRYRKKVLEIDAIVWDGGNAAEVCAFAPALDEHTHEPMKPSIRVDRGTGGTPVPKSAYPRLIVQTLEGWLWADKGDYIIKGIKGEFYPCKPEIFIASYDEVEE